MKVQKKPINKVIFADYHFLFENLNVLNVNQFYERDYKNFSHLWEVFCLYKEKANRYD